MTAKCINEKGHDFQFIGFMVVCEELPKSYPDHSPKPVTPKSGGTLDVSYPLMELPSHFPAKIEVHQCSKCGEIKLQAAVFSRILKGDKD